MFWKIGKNLLLIAHLVYCIAGPGFGPVRFKCGKSLMDQRKRCFILQTDKKGPESLDGFRGLLLFIYCWC